MVKGKPRKPARPHRVNPQDPRYSNSVRATGYPRGRGSSMPSHAPKAMTKEEVMEAIKENLPHGSGINADWLIEDKGAYWGAYNGYETMTEHGMYDSWANFQLIIPKRDPDNFKLHFVGSEAQYQNQKYMLRDYLEDTFAESIRDMQEQGIL